MKRLESGQSLFELTVALGISALIIVALVSLVNNSIQNSNFSKNKTLAATYAQEATEWLREERDSDPATFFDVNVQVSETTPRCFNDLTWSRIDACGEGEFIANTPFVRQITFSQDPTTLKTVIVADVTVSWKDGTTEHVVTNSTSFSDWRQR